MNKTDMLNSLFEKWKARRLLFCEDGILYADRYDTAKIKVLFVLKDVNNPTVNAVADTERSDDGKNIDMRKVFRDTEEKNCRTWAPIFRWLSTLLGNISSPEDYFAFINIKKDEGQGSIAPSTLFQYAERDCDLIKQQIEIISPNLIISCGRDVFNCLHEKIFDQKEFIPHKVFSGTDKLDYGKAFTTKIGTQSTLVVEYHHPTARNSYTETQHQENMDAIRMYYENNVRNVE